MSSFIIDSCYYSSNTYPTTKKFWDNSSHGLTAGVKSTELYKTLAYLLLQTPEDDLQTAAFHLTRTHGWSEQVVPENDRYGFKTFGGANLAMMLMPDPKDPNNHVELAVLKGKFHRKSDKKVVSDVYKNDQGNLCVKGEDGIEYLLKPFSQYDFQGMDSLELAINQKP